MKAQQLAKSLGENGLVVSGSTTDEFKTYIKREPGKYAQLAKAANIRLEN
jgi:tripartite-type tricarboxylate transporter receptor subunit TctC